MSEFELEKKKQDKRDRKEFKETLVAVGEEDEPLVGTSLRLRSMTMRRRSAT